MPSPARWLAAPLVSLAAVAAGAACGRPAASSAVDGREVFAYACANCHGAEGTPPASMAAQLGVRDLRSAEFRARVTPELVEHQVRTGSKNKLMPSFVSALSDAQIRAVSTFVAGGLEQASPASPTAPAASTPAAPAPAAPAAPGPGRGDDATAAPGQPGAADAPRATTPQL